MNSETLANGQNFAVFRINEASSNDGAIYVDQSAGALRLCIGMTLQAIPVDPQL